MADETGARTGRSRPLTVARSALAVLRLLRVPIVCGAITVLALLVPEQTPEIIRALVQRVLLPFDEWLPWVELSLAISGFGLIVLMLWWIARQLAARLGDDLAPEAHRALDPVVRALVLLLFAAAALAIWRSRTQDPDSQTRDAVVLALRREFPRLHKDAPVMAALFSYNRILAYAAVVTGLAGVAMAALLPKLSIAPREFVAGGATSLLGRAATIAAYGAGAVIFLVFIASPVRVPITVGSLAILFAFIICMALVLAQFSYWSDRHRLPYIALLVTWIVGLSLLDLNDNHTIYRTASSAAPAQVAAANASPLQIDTAFRRWWEARPDKARYEQRNQPYPVYVVAAQGGGIYAAFHTASILSALQDDCPGFAHHLFAISSVSGGSLGAAAFAGLVTQTEGEALAGAVASPCREAPRAFRQSMVDLADTMLSEDLLAPLVSGLLFSDFFQQVVPYPLPSLDRALRLEKSFERAMDVATGRLAASKTRKDRVAGPNFLSSRFADHWSAADSTPALVINTTEVGSGRRRILSPFEFARDDLLFVPLSELPVSGSGASRSELPVSAAAVLSARFPWVTPAGSFREYVRDAATGQPLPGQQLRKVRVVDGAYFENSGVATALDLIRAMEQTARSGPAPFADKIRIRLIVLTRGGYPSQTFYGLGETVSPIQALLNTQTSRAFITIAEAERLLNAAVPPQRETAQLLPRRLHKIILRDLDYPPPLGWYLSPITTLLIRAQNGVADACKPVTDGSQSRRGRFLSDADADCLLNDVTRELKGE